MHSLSAALSFLPQYLSYPLLLVHTSIENHIILSAIIPALHLSLQCRATRSVTCLVFSTVDRTLTAKPNFLVFVIHTSKNTSFFCFHQLMTVHSPQVA